MSVAELIQIGGCEVVVDDAREWVGTYLNGATGQYGYPSYDGYTTNDDAVRLCDGDLLAPALLNVQVRIMSFADLCDCRDEVETALAGLPRNVELAAATDEVLELVGRLYSVLDSDHRPQSVLGTTLAKVLHRKRPELIPLYDENVRRVYQDGDGAPVPLVVGRSWVEFMTLLAAAMRDDLNRSVEVWDDFRRLAPRDGPPVSRLRALDIVAWHRGESFRSDGGQADGHS